MHRTQDELDARGGAATRPGLGAATALSAAAAVAGALTGTWTLIDPGLLHGPEAMNGSARGTGLVLVALALPVLLVSMRKARQGSGRAVVLWMSALLYLLYNAILFLFLTPFNDAFLVYVALLGTTLWSIWALASALDLEELSHRFSVRAPVRGVAIYIWVVVVLNALAWLAGIVPALGSSYPPDFLDGTGVTTSAIYVQDLALWLPLMAVAGVWLRRRDPRGLFVSSAVLGMWVIESVSIAVDQWFGHHLDPSSDAVSTALVGPFLALAVIGVVPVVLLLRGFDEVTATEA